MLLVRKVLLPTDFSGSGRSALHRGIDLARQFGAEIHRIHVLPFSAQVPIYPLTSAAPSLQPLLDDLRAEAARRLAEESTALDLAGIEHCSHVLESGMTADKVLMYAEESEVDLIVMGTHGHRGFRKFLLGSVAEEVVRKARCPVWTCLPETDPVASRPERILVPVDLSDHSPAQVDHAAELALIYDAGLVLLHVIPEYRAPAAYSAGEIVVPLPDLEAVRENAAKALSDFASKCLTKGVKAETVVDVGGPVATIREVAQGCDLVVMASHGLTGLSHILLGSVTERVIRDAHTPVLTLHSFGRSWIAGQAPAGS